MHLTLCNSSHQGHFVKKRSMSMYFHVFAVLIGAIVPMQLVNAGFSSPLMGPRCLKCQSAPNILECSDVAVCHPHEVCYVQKRISDMGTEFIDAGCRSQEVCDLLGCFKADNSSLRAKRSTPWSAITCHQCCDEDFCNLNGCQDSLISDPKIDQCFECDSVPHPRYCNSIRSCEDNEECYTTMTIEGTLERYTMGCQKRAMCDILNSIVRDRRRRDIMAYSECCDSHLCNRDTPPIKGLPALTKSYHCPTKSILPLAESNNSDQ